MNDQRLSHDERAFMQSLGIDPDDLEALVANAPDLREQARASVQQLTWQKIDGSALSGAATGAGSTKPGRRSRRWLWFAAAAAAMCLVTVSVSPAVQAALHRLMQFVPGIGITETASDTLVLAAPVTVSSEHGNLTITAFIATADYSELRYVVDGVRPEKSDLEQSPNASGGAFLILPDGTRLKMAGAMASGGGSYQSGTITFPALPSPADEVTVELDGLFGLPDKYTATFHLVDADTAGLEPAIPGSQSAVQHGLTVSVPHLAFVGDRIFLTVDTQLEPPAVRRDFVARTAENLVLTDDTGHRYELLEDESNAYGDAGGPLSVVFAGPVRTEASSLHLSVSGIEVIEQGSDRLRVPLSSLRRDERLELDETLAIGRWTATVHAITWVDDEQFDIELGVSREFGDGRTLRYIRVRPYKVVRGGHGYSYDFDDERERTTVSFFYEPTGRYLDLEFHDPTVHVAGPWELQLPIR